MYIYVAEVLTGTQTLTYVPAYIYYNYIRAYVYYMHRHINNSAAERECMLEIVTKFISK